MTRQQAEQFINVYNALLTISTKGNDTKTMAQILTVMEQLADTIQVIEEPAPQATPAVEEEPETEGE
jgi:hypothetical protein